MELGVSLYRGLLLEGCSEEWVTQDRQARSLAYLNAREKLADMSIARAEYSRAIEHLRRVIAIDPLRECAQRSLIEALAACGDHSAAVQVYRELRRLLRDELNTEPDPETRRVFEHIREQAKIHATDHRPALRISVPAPHQAISGPPNPLTSIVGRVREVAELRAKIVTGRLVTLTGPGGVGKTRLSIEVAHDLKDEFADGILFIDLAPLTEPELVPITVAAKLGIRDEAGQSMVSALSRTMMHREMLIVLDNCEHLIDPCARLVDTLLTHCGDLKVLATSRQPLGVTGEVDFRVQPLSLPPQGDAGADDETSQRLISESESVQLFAERARAAFGNFTLDARTLGSVASVCRRLDGIPLAIELAAARAKRFTVYEIESRLDDVFELLTEGSRTALPRQQTMLAAMDWSYDLLEVQERVLFNRLSVFAGPFDIHAVREVGSDHAVPTASVERLIAGLLDKSLISLVTRAVESRFTMLEITREYAAAKLKRSGEDNDIRQRHAEYFLDVAVAVQIDWERNPTAALIRIDEVERDLRAVLAWCINSAQGRSRVERALSMARTLAVHCDQQGRAAEGRRWIDDLLCLLPDRTANRASALLRSSAMSICQDDWHAARTAAREALSIFRELGDRSGTARALSSLGRVLCCSSEAAESLKLFEEAEEIYNALGDLAGQTSVMTNYGIAHFALADYARSRAYHENCLALVTLRESETGKAWALDNLGDVAIMEGEYITAHSHYRAALPRFAAIRHFVGVAECLRGIAQVYVARGGRDDAYAAAVMFGAVESLRFGLDPVLPMFREAHRQAVEQVKKLLGEEEFMAAWNTGRRMEMEAAVATATTMP